MLQFKTGFSHCEVKEGSAQQGLPTLSKHLEAFCETHFLRVPWQWDPDYDLGLEVKPMHEVVGTLEYELSVLTGNFECTQRRVLPFILDTVPGDWSQEDEKAISCQAEVRLSGLDSRSIQGYCGAAMQCDAVRPRGPNTAAGQSTCLLEQILILVGLSLSHASCHLWHWFGRAPICMDWI